MRRRDKSLPTGIFNDIFCPPEDGEVLARYTGNYYAGAPALVRRAVGAGTVLHFGGTFTRETAAAILRYLNAASPWRDVLTLPEDCELCVREKGEKRWFFVLNYAPQPRKITLHEPLTDAETGEAVSSEIVLNPYEVKVFL